VSIRWMSSDVIMVVVSPEEAVEVVESELSGWDVDLDFSEAAAWILDSLSVIVGIVGIHDV